jgi:outer membrane protein OmpA-like peptidoglycan-associated protein
MKKIACFIPALLLLGSTMNAQNAAEEADKAASAKQVSTEYAKSDFVPGDEIFFDDDFANEQLGEFPQRWELLDGYVETASVCGRKVLAFTDNGIGQVMPNMKEEWAWLPEIFTIEYDLYIAPLIDEDVTSLDHSLCFGTPGQSDYYNAGNEILFRFREDGSCSISWSLEKPGGGNQTIGDKALGLSDAFEDYVADSPVKAGQWNHFAFSFNKRAFKGYINGVRIINVPSMQAPGYFYFASGSEYRYSGISNVRIAKGAVPLYDRLMADGKITTYAITFETGKADLNPESIVEILRIAKLMQENPGLEFEVEGHCDSTGSDAVNDPLSQQRAEAIVAALVEQGIAQARLTPVGKGSHQPIASNSTDEGRAKNRRVEFIKK